MQAHPEVAYDPFNPYPWYQHMREARPVYYNEQVRMWYAFRYNDVQQVLTDIQTFTSEMPIDSYLSASFFRMDPPRHGRYRTLVSQAFTPRSVALMEPRIGQELRAEEVILGLGLRGERHGHSDPLFSSRPVAAA